MSFYHPLEAPDNFFLGTKFFLLIISDGFRQKFLVWRTPIDQKMNVPKWQFLLFFRKKNLIFENVAEICVRNFDRNFWQHGGDPLGTNCLETRIHEILWIIRRDRAPQIWAKIDFFHVFFMKNHQKCQLVSQNRVLASWGGAAQLWVGKKLFSTNQSRFTQKEISDRAHPLSCKNDASKMSAGESKSSSSELGRCRTALGW